MWQCWVEVRGLAISIAIPLRSLRAPATWKLVSPIFSASCRAVKMSPGLVFL